MKISIIGTGNVAGILGAKLKLAGHKVVWVYGRDQKKSILIAKKLQSKSLTDLSNCALDNPDIIIIAVSDDALLTIAKKVYSAGCLVVHTSGSVDLLTLKKYHPRAGVFYPLQTFSSKSRINFKTIPICIEASSEKDLQLLMTLAYSLSKNVYVTDSLQRSVIHLAAVIANNFSNHLFSISASLLKEENLPFDLLRPIILTAAKNIQYNLPDQLQTGPAKRNDMKVINRHIKMLKKHQKWMQLYQLISADIINVNSHKN